MSSHIPRKRFGQNFLIDHGIIGEIVGAVAPRTGDTVVEIGPGLGALTGPLLEWAGHMHVVELDRDLVARLQRSRGDQLTIHSGDALDFDFGALAESGRRLRIVGNLPYNISSPLLFHLLQFAEVVHDQHFMLQKEVVERMVAEPGSKAFGRLSVMLQVRYSMESIIDVPPTSFNPPPKVDSAVVRMIPWPAAMRDQLGLVCDEIALGQLVMAAFSQRRKVLRNTLGAYRERLDFDALGFDLSRRAEEVPVAEYVRLTRVLTSHGSATA